jgi:hypothetical protein
MFRPAEAIVLVAKPGYPEPPLNHAALKKALREEKAAS